MWLMEKDMAVDMRGGLWWSDKDIGEVKPSRSSA